MRTKRWLESTTHLELPFDAYEFAPDCTVSCLDGSVQTFDLRGWFFENKRGLFVENKAYTGVGKQPMEYKDFLAIAYSATAAEIARTQDPRWEFMWVTTHPFDQTAWPTLTKRSTIKAAIEANKAAAEKDDKTDLLNGAAIDEDILDLVTGRVWLLVLNKRQKELTITRSELNKIEAVLKRKKKGKAA